MRYPQGPQIVTTGEDLCPLTPLYTRFNLDGGRSQELSRFYQVRTQGSSLPKIHAWPASSNATSAARFDSKAVDETEPA